jgi:hypothetical protein
MLIRTWNLRLESAQVSCWTTGAPPPREALRQTSWPRSARYVCVDATRGCMHACSCVWCSAAVWCSGVVQRCGAAVWCSGVVQRCGAAVWCSGVLQRAVWCSGVVIYNVVVRCGSVVRCAGAIRCAAAVLCSRAPKCNRLLLDALHCWRMHQLPPSCLPVAETHAEASHYFNAVIDR